MVLLNEFDISLMKISNQKVYFEDKRVLALFFLCIFHILRGCASELGISATSGPWAKSCSDYHPTRPQCLRVSDQAGQPVPLA